VETLSFGAPGNGIGARARCRARSRLPRVPRRSGHRFGAWM